jgi:hypothetical protein
MAQVFLRYRLREPALIRQWIFEEQVKTERRIERAGPKYGEKLPDAFLRSDSGERAIEFGGAYGKDKVAAFHGYCKERSLAYELW